MKDVIYLLVHLLTTLTKLIRPGGRRTVIAENLLVIVAPFFLDNLALRPPRRLFPGLELVLSSRPW